MLSGAEKPEETLVNWENGSARQRISGWKADWFGEGGGLRVLFDPMEFKAIVKYLSRQGC